MGPPEEISKFHIPYFKGISQPFSEFIRVYYTTPVKRAIKGNMNTTRF